jgi:hypothetical protein
VHNVALIQRHEFLAVRAALDPVSYCTTRRGFQEERDWKCRDRKVAPEERVWLEVRNAAGQDGTVSPCGHDTVG